MNHYRVEVTVSVIVEAPDEDAAYSAGYWIGGDVRDRPEFMHEPEIADIAVSSIG